MFISRNDWSTGEKILCLTLFLESYACPPTQSYLTNLIPTHASIFSEQLYFFFESPVWLGSMSSTSSCFWRPFSRLSSCQLRRTWEWIMKTTLDGEWVTSLEGEPSDSSNKPRICSISQKYPWQERPNRKWWVRKANRVPGTSRELTSIIYRTWAKKGTFKKSIYVWVNGRKGI